jgi:hypothetical protein
MILDVVVRVEFADGPKTKCITLIEWMQGSRRLLLGFSSTAPFPGFSEAIAFAVHFQDMDVVG